MGNLFSSNETEEQVFDKEYQKYVNILMDIPSQNIIEKLDTKTTSLASTIPRPISNLIDRLNINDILTCITKGPCSKMAYTYYNLFDTMKNWYLLCNYETVNNKPFLNVILNIPNRYKTKALLVLDYIILLRDYQFTYTTGKIKNGIEVSFQVKNEEGLYYLLELIVYLQLFDIIKYGKDWQKELTIDGTYLSGDTKPLLKSKVINGRKVF